eukprot:g51663.t1
MTLCPIKIRHWKEIWHIWMRSTTLKAPLQSSREISCRYDLNTLKLALKPPQKSDLRREERHVTHRPPNATKKGEFFSESHPLAPDARNFAPPNQSAWDPLMLISRRGDRATNLV